MKNVGYLCLFQNIASDMRFEFWSGAKIFYLMVNDIVLSGWEEPPAYTSSALGLEVADSSKTLVVRYTRLCNFITQKPTIIATVSAETKHQATCILALSFTIQNTVFAMAIDFLYVPK